MVAAAKLRRAELAAAAARPYAERMERVLANLASSMRDAPGAPQLLAGTGEDRRHLLVVMTADRGLAGGFNASIARLARDEARRLIAEGKEVRFLCVGRKGADILRRQFPGKIDDVISLREVKTLGYSTANEIGERIIKEYQDGGFDVATLFFSKFRSVVSQIPTAQQVIPAQIPEATGEDQLNGAIYEYEPSEEEILEVLLPKNVSIQIFKGLLENAASEQGARMSAMDNATRNAGEMIKKLSLQYNRTRQAQITKELIEIISGAEAL